MSLQIEIDTRQGAKNVETLTNSIEALMMSVTKLSTAGTSLGKLQKEIKTLSEFDNPAVKLLAADAKSAATELSKLKQAQTKYNKELATLDPVVNAKRFGVVTEILKKNTTAAESAINRLRGSVTGAKVIIMAHMDEAGQLAAKAAKALVQNSQAATGMLKEEAFSRMKIADQTNAKTLKGAETTGRELLAAERNTATERKKIQAENARIQQRSAQGKLKPDLDLGAIEKAALLEKLAASKNMTVAAYAADSAARAAASKKAASESEAFFKSEEARYIAFNKRKEAEALKTGKVIHGATPEINKLIAQGYASQLKGANEVHALILKSHKDRLAKEVAATRKAQQEITSPVLNRINSQLVSQSKLLEGAERGKYEGVYGNLLNKRDIAGRLQAASANQKALKDDLDGFKNMLRLQVAAQSRAQQEMQAAATRAVYNTAAAQIDAATRAREAVYQTYDPKTQKAGRIVQPLAQPVPAVPLANLPKPKDVDDLSKSFKQLALNGNDVHSMARGLASGFNLLWLTWGNLAPLMAGAALSFGVKSVVQLGSEVQHTMETIRVLSQESSTSVAALNDQLLELARTGPYGPLEVANAMKTLSLAGLDAAEAGLAIRDVLNFAVAGTTDLKTASDVMTSVATAFSVSVEAYNYVGDVIAKTAAISKSSVESIGEAFKTSSVVHKQYGASLEDVGLGLAALSNLGIQGTAAGTALRNMYVDLSGRTPAVAKAMKALGLELTDTSGNFKDIVTMTKDLDTALSKLSNRGEKKALMDLLSERGGKPVIELLDLVRTRAKESGDSVTNELDRMQAKLASAAGFMAISAAELAMTPANQMKSVYASLQATLVETFRGMEPAIVGLSYQLKEMFASAEFKQGLQTMTTLALNFAGGLVTLTKFVVEHSQAISVLVGTYLSLRLAMAGFAALVPAIAAAKGLMTRAVVAETAALVANTTATATNVAAKGAGLLTVARLLPGVGTAVTLATVAWLAYETVVGKSKETSEALASSNASATLSSKLMEETARLNENTEAMLKNISVEQLRLSKASAAPANAEKLTKAETEYAGALAEVARQEKALEAIRSPAGTGATKLRLTGLDAARAEAQQKRDALEAQQENARLEARQVSRNRELVVEAAKANSAAEAAKAKAEAAKLRDWAAGAASPTGTSASAPASAADALNNDLRYNRLAEIEKANNAQLEGLRNRLSSEASMLKDFRDANLVEDGAYQSRVTSLTMEGEKAQRDSLINGWKGYEAEIARLMAGLEAMPKSKISDSDKANRRQELYEKLRAYAEKANDDLAKIEEDGAQRERRLYVDQYKELARLRKSNENSIASSQDRVSAMLEESAMADATMGLGGAQLEATKARLKIEMDAKKPLREFDSTTAELRSAQARLVADAEKESDNEVWEAKHRLALQLDAQIKALAQGRADFEVQTQTEVATTVADVHRKADRARTEALASDVTSAIESALFEGGDAGSRKLRGVLEAELRKPITLAINAFVTPLISSVMGSFGIGGGSGAGGGATGVFGTLKGIYDMVTGGPASAASSAFNQFATSGAGEALGLSTPMTYTTGSGVTNGLTSTGSSLSGLAGTAGNALAGYGLYKGLSGGYSINKTLDKLGAVASLFGPVYGAIGGLVNRSFGRKLKDTGIQGSFGGAEGFTGENYEFYKGGWFRSDKTKTSAMDSEMQTALGSQFKALKGSVAGMAQALGMSSEAVTSYTADIKLSLKGLSEEEVGQKLAEEFAKMGEGMAALLPGIDIYRKAGESASEALTRLYGYYVNEKQAEIAILNAQGKRIEALNVQRNLELALLDDVEKASKQRIYALEDEVAAATEAAGLQQQVNELTLTAVQLRAKEREALMPANQALFDHVTALQKVAEAKDVLVGALNDLVSNLTSTVEDFKNLGESLAAYRTSLSSGPAAQLSPQDAYNSTRAAFVANQALALTGDKAALGKVESLGDSFLEASESFFASNSSYFADLDLVKIGTDAAIAAALAQETAATQAKTDAEKQLEALGQVKTAVDSVEDATRAVQAAVIQLSKASALETYSSMVASGATPLAAFTQAAATVNASTMPAADKESSLAALKTSASADSGTFAMKTYTSALGAGKSVVGAATEAQRYLQSSSSIMTTAQMESAFAPIREKAVGSVSVSEGLKAQIREAEAAENAAFAKLGFAYAGGFTVDANGKPVWSSTEMNGQPRWAKSGGGGWNASLGAYEGPAALAAMRGGTPAQWNDYWSSMGTRAAPAQDPSAPWNRLDALSKQYNSELKAQNSSISALQFAKGGAFTNGIVTEPTMFNMGQMGEAGPEAIMPLTRMADGSLGVAYSGQQANDELVAELRALRAEVAELKQHSAANVRVAQAVGKAQIAHLETIADATIETAQTNKLAELAR